MRKIVTVQAPTVEEATRQALALLKLTKKEVRVEVLSNPGRRLMGLRKVMAEVRVTKIEKTSTENESLGFEEIIDAMIENEGLPQQQAKELLPSEEHVEMGVRIAQGELEFVFGTDANPVLEPSKNVSLYVNGELINEKVTIYPGDKVDVTLSDELKPPQFSIKLIEQEMIALLSFTPGEKTLRTLSNTKFQASLKLVVEERIEYYNDLKPQEIVDELKEMGVQQGLLFPAISKVVSATKAYELIVAKGTLPIEGSDGDLEIHIEFEEFDPDSIERVDFREVNAITNVREGEVIATHILPVQGIPGQSLLGKPIPVKPVRDILLRVGKNVELIEQDIVAKISGKPSFDWRDKLVKVEVTHEFNHPGEVSLESGNIRFEGDVKVGGNVLPKMFVGATGSILVGGSVTQATLHAMKSVIVTGNVLSSTINVGKQEVSINELVRQLKEVTVFLVEIRDAVEQIFLIRGNTEVELAPADLKHLIYLLLEKKYTRFEVLNKQFIQSVRESNTTLEPEWTMVTDKLYDMFISTYKDKLEGMAGFQLLIDEAKELAEVHEIEAVSQAEIVLPYAVNSELYSSGDIRITSKGVFQSTLIAENNITIQGVCRGGKITAKNEVVLQETGSESFVKTVIKTGEKGRIKIGKAYIGTEIQIGLREHKFSRDELEVHARIDEDGQIILR